MSSIDSTAHQLAELYSKGFGGKPSGRYRVPAKIVRGLMGRRRLYAEDVQALTRALFEKGFVLVDMDTFFVVLSANTFVNYRRVSQDAVTE